MIEKRFTANLTHYGTSRNHITGINDNQTNREIVDIIGVVELLNAQHEEIQSLKDQLRNLRRLVNELYMEGSE